LASVTGGLLPFQFVRTLQAPDRNGIGVKEVTQSRFEIPFRTGHATEEIQAERAVLGKSVAGEMGLGEKTEAGDSAGSGKLMPLRRAYGAETHLFDNLAEEILENCPVTQRSREAAKGFDDPLDSVHGA